jgi:hypothetical protein
MLLDLRQQTRGGYLAQRGELNRQSKYSQVCDFCNRAGDTEQVTALTSFKLFRESGGGGSLLLGSSTASSAATVQGHAHRSIGHTLDSECTLNPKWTHHTGSA